jgi:uncharacterized membrane protein YeiH
MFVLELGGTFVFALSGATAAALGHALHARRPASAVVGAAACFGIRLLALWRGWRLPRLK